MDKTYYKSIPDEIIEIGDLIMLDPETGHIKRAVATNLKSHIINSRLIIGVCINSDNEAKSIIKLDCDKSQETDRVIIDGGSAQETDRVIIDGGASGQNTREVIEIAYQGEQLVNIKGYVDLGDQLCISDIPGKAKSKDYLEREYFDTRSIGKVIKFTNNKNKVKVLLNIE